MCIVNHNEALTDCLAVSIVGFIIYLIIDYNLSCLLLDYHYLAILQAILPCAQLLFHKYCIVCCVIVLSLLCYHLLQYSFSCICNVNSHFYFPALLYLQWLSMYVSSFPGWILSIIMCMSVYLVYLYILQEIVI